MAGEVARRLGLSPEQTRAVVDCDHDVLVSAGAGTGKTRVLTARYLTLLLERDLRPAQVAALTFTNKAAAEMRARIRDGLLALADLFPRAPELLGELSWAPIETIHSFCGRLLRDDPLAAGVQPGFRVLEEGEADLILRESCELALAGLLTTEPEPSGLDGLLRAFGWRMPPTLLAETYRTLRQWGLAPGQAAGEPDPGRELARLRDELGEWWSDLLAREAPADLAPGTRAARDELARLGEAFAATVQRAGEDEPDEAVLDQVRQILGDLRAGEFKTLATAGRERLLRFNQALAANRAFRIAPAFLAAIKTAAKGYEEAKAARNALDFADLEIKARDLVSRGMRERYAALLVDEFQDTNPLQWAIIRDLRCRLFAVGDVKQSIYRFRGADVRVMTNLREDLTAGGGRVYSLQENYRCQPALAALVNHACGQMLERDGLYEPLLPQRTDPLTAVRAELMLVPSETLDRPGEAAFIAARIGEMLADGLPVADRESDTIRPIAPGDIALLFRATTDLYHYEKALRQAGLPYRVIAGSGFYRRDEVADLLALLAAVEDAGDGLALAAVLRSPLFGVGDDSLYWLAREAGLADGFMTADLEDPVLGTEGLLLLRARDLLATLRARRHLLGIESVLAEAVEATDYRALQSAYPDYRQRLANLDKLLRVAKQYTAMGRGETGEFLAYLEALSTLAVRESEASLAGGEEAIQLLTVHGAKGLEFPVVFLPDLARTLPRQGAAVMVAEDGRIGFRFGARSEGRTSPIWNELEEAAAAQEEAEVRRLLYVAMTRARDYLILVGSGARAGATWQHWLQEVLPPSAAGDLLPYPGGVIQIHREVPVPVAAPAARTLAALHPQIRRGEALDLPVEAAAALELPAEKDLGRPAAEVDLTVTGVLDFRRCPRLFYYRHLLHLPEPASDLGGGAGGGEVGGGGPALGSQVHALAARMAASGEVRPNPGGSDLERLLDNYRRSVSYQALTGASRVWTEYGFLLATPRGRLIGACDLIWLGADGLSRLVDLKTNRISAPGSELLDEHSFQLRLYALALRRLFSGLAGAARLEYLWPGIGVDVPLDEEILAVVEGELLTIQGFIAVHRGYAEFPATPAESCRWCGYGGRVCRERPASKDLFTAETQRAQSITD